MSCPCLRVVFTDETAAIMDSLHLVTTVLQYWSNWIGRIGVRTIAHYYTRSTLRFWLGLSEGKHSVTEPTSPRCDDP